MDNSYTIKDVINLLLSKLWLIILCCVVCGSGAFSVAYFLMPKTYESYTSMYVRNSDSVLGGFNIDVGELNASRSLLSTYVVVLKSNYVMEQVAQQLELDYSYDELANVFVMKDNKILLDSLRSKISMSSVDSTEVMRITAITNNPEISAAICNSLSDSASECLIRIVGAGSVEIIDVANPIYSPVSPNKPKITLLGALAGLLVSVLIVFVIDFFDNTIKSSEIITNKYNKAVFGEIINFGSKKSEGLNSHSTIIDSKMDFNVIENYKSIRSNIIFAFSTLNRKVLAVSSANPGEGKSTTASNIALAFSQTGGKILLIDGDMRKPVQHKIFNLGNKKGLSTAIGHMNSVEESINKGVNEQLDVMTSGPIPPNPSEMLASQQFVDMIKELESQYDYIIIDTPPVNVVSDTFVMNKVISGLILVVEYAKTTFYELQDAIKRADLSEINLIGFVLNNISRKGSGHYYSYKYKYKYKNYEYGYGYRSDTEEKLSNVSIVPAKEEKISDSEKLKEESSEEKTDKETSDSEKLKEESSEEKTDKETSDSEKLKEESSEEKTDKETSDSEKLKEESSDEKTDKETPDSEKLKKESSEEKTDKETPDSEKLKKESSEEKTDKETSDSEKLKEESSEEKTDKETSDSEKLKDKSSEEKTDKKVPNNKKSE